MENRNNEVHRRLDKTLVKQITAIFGAENTFSSREDLMCYGYDATNLEALPDLVVFPKAVSEISEILILANKHRFPVVPRGMGTGFSGGSIPIRGDAVALSPASYRLNPTKIAEDITVPRNQIATFIREARKIAEEKNLKIINFGHGGDGNLHSRSMPTQKENEDLSGAQTFTSISAMDRVCGDEATESLLWHGRELQPYLL